jgi:tRNA threonylcarbamoyladenosine biosynthesis protein TsaB
VLLALDTATSWGSVALYDGHEVLAESSWRSQRRHGDELFPQIERTLEVAGVALRQIDRIAVSIGPGSFTGLRIAIAAAKGLARGLDARVAGIPTLDALAFAYTSAAVVVCPLISSGRHEFYAAFYEPVDIRESGWASAWPRRSPYVAGTLEQIAARASAPTLFVGETHDEVQDTLRDLLPARALFGPAASGVRRAGHLAELGWRRLESGSGMQTDTLEPIYVKQAGVRAESGGVEAPAAERGAPKARTAGAAH